MGGEVPRYFNLLQQGRVDEGMALYWRLHPARQAYAHVHESFRAGAGLVHRMVWKYQYWLSGFNGGPIRQPLPRVNDAQMRTLRQGLIRAGLTPAPGEDHEFFVGRHPME
jgi:4-hydroxy-tetrahydrodipicolinate synthase